MKIYFIAVLLVLFSTNTCSKQEVNSIEFFSYETFTRGSSANYTITAENIKMKSTGMNARENTTSISSAEWDSLMQIASKIDASKMSQLIAPTDSRASDAALHAILSVRKNDSIFKTNSFDHGSPPKEVKPLVEAILRLAENVE